MANDTLVAGDEAIADYAVIDELFVAVAAIACVVGARTAADGSVPVGIYISFVCIICESKLGIGGMDR